MAKPATEFHAYFSDVAKIHSAAVKLGWKDDGSSYFDVLDPNDSEYATGQTFADLPSATSWLQEQIAAKRSLFGVGDITEGRKVERRDRCRYCTCNGWKRERVLTVDDEGIAQDEYLPDDCCN